jgi:hypothetical protein
LARLFTLLDIAAFSEPYDLSVCDLPATRVLTSETPAPPHALPQAIARRRAEEAGLSNLRTLLIDIAAFAEPFDLGVSLHACGEATDLALQACAEAGARFAHCPCCVGKVARGRKNNVTFNSTGSYSEQPRKNKTLKENMTTKPQPPPTVGG